MSEFAIVSFVLVLVVLAVFAWLAKTIFDLRKATEAGFRDVEHKIVGLEDAAIALKKELDKIDSSLENKINKQYLDERIEALLRAVRKRR
ncbi:MAG: hypothetical protein QW343_03335 [Candidatus Norongarragalinales archaeon]